MRIDEEWLLATQLDAGIPVKSTQSVDLPRYFWGTQRVHIEFRAAMPAAFLVFVG